MYRNYSNIYPSSQVRCLLYRKFHATIRSYIIESGKAKTMPISIEQNSDIFPNYY